MIVLLTQHNCEDLKGLHEILVNNGIHILLEFRSLVIFIFTGPFVFQKYCDKYLVQLAYFLNKKIRVRFIEHF